MMMLILFSAVKTRQRQPLPSRKGGLGHRVGRGGENNKTAMMFDYQRTRLVNDDADDDGSFDDDGYDI